MRSVEIHFEEHGDRPSRASESLSGTAFSRASNLGTPRKRMATVEMKIDW